MDGEILLGSRRIALLAGGDSAEREVSLASSEQVARGLWLADYEPVLIDPAVVELLAVDWTSFDAAFIALHGGAGEDGRIQAQLELFRVPYTGSDAAASRLAMSKSAAKERFLRCGVPTLPYAVVSADDRTNATIGDELSRRVAPLGFPLIVKPESQGSSLGVILAHGLNDLPRCVASAGQWDRFLLVEPYIAGREFTISLLGRDPLPLIEIIAPQSVFSFDAKYSSLETRYHLATGLPPSIESQLYRSAIAAAEALGTAGLVRVDLMLDIKDQPWVLEVNNIPGMTARSLAPRAAMAAGMEMPELVDWMVRDALRRGRTSQNATFHGVLA